MRRMTLADLPRRYQEQVYAAENILAPRLPHPIPKQDAILSPLGADQDESGSVGRIAVRITRRGTKLLDIDNLYGSVKFVCDALRYTHLIPEDDPEAITLEVRQEKVKRDACGTLIEIATP